MAGLTDADWQAQLLTELNDTAGVLGTRVPLLWQQYAERRAIGGPQLQYLYAKRHAIDLLLALIRDDVDSTIPSDMSSKEDQKTGHLRLMRVDVLAEIARLEKRARATRGGAVLPIAAQAPPLPQWPTPTQQQVGVDAGDPALSGSPYAATLGTRGVDPLAPDL